MEEVFSRSFSVEGESFEAIFRRRPFREGFQVSIAVNDTVLTVGELGLGERDLLERAKRVVREYLFSNASLLRKREW